jgi:hypothetical protein
MLAGKEQSLSLGLKTQGEGSIHRVPWGGGKEATHSRYVQCYNLWERFNNILGRKKTHL